MIVTRIGLMRKAVGVCRTAADRPGREQRWTAAAMAQTSPVARDPGAPVLSTAAALNRKALIMAEQVSV